MPATTASEQWRAELAGGAIHPAILPAPPAKPHAFDPTPVPAAHQADPTPGPLLRRAHEALLEGGTVLDVGAGAGAASLPLAPPASLVVAVDTSATMLDELERSAAERGVAVTRVEGSWPESAPDV